MECPICAAPLTGASECKDCGYVVLASDQKKSREGSAGRPRPVSLAATLLLVDALFDALRIFNTWSHLGLAVAGSNRANWFVPFLLGVRFLLIALLWMGNSWARTMLIVLFALGLVNLLSTVALLNAMGSGYFVFLLPWIGVMMQVYAVYLLFQSESLDWFRK
jgi:hypothetical protein